MKNSIAVLIIALASVWPSSAQSPSGIQWDRTLGGSDTDYASVVQPTSDGGYLVGGYSYSDVSGAKSSASYGAGDFWVAKLDANGFKQWDKTFGGAQFDGITCLQSTSDGGSILGGVSFSDVSGSKTSGGFGGSDYWVVKLDSSGNKQWDKTFGGNSNDVLHGVQPTADGGYILGGNSFSDSSGNKSSSSQGAGDFWVVKLDANGNRQWDKSYGGSDRDELQSVQQIADGGFMLGGSSFSGSTGNKSTASLGAGTSDYWILKLNSNGNRQWEKAFGGNDDDELFSLQLTSDGGFILGGHSYSGVSGNKTAASFGAHDYWVVKLDSNGNRQWDKVYGGDNSEELYSVQPTSDGGYILGGNSVSGVSGNKTSPAPGTDARAYWIVKLGASGDKQWETSLAGSFSGGVSRLMESRDGGYVFAGVMAAAPTALTDYSVTKLSAPLRMHSYSFRPNGVFQARITGMAGTNYVLQATTNFTNWTSLLTNNAGDGNVIFVATNTSPFARRFYRVRLQP